MNLFNIFIDLVKIAPTQELSASGMLKAFGVGNKSGLIGKIRAVKNSYKFGGTNTSFMKFMAETLSKGNFKNAKLINDFFKIFVPKANKGKVEQEIPNVELWIEANQEVALSSSWLVSGFFVWYHGKHYNNNGTLKLIMSGKEYEFPNVPLSVWVAMVKARGRNGTGAGSVLWNTIWWSKRTKSLQTGGQAGQKQATSKMSPAEALKQSRLRLQRRISYYKRSQKYSAIPNRISRKRSKFTLRSRRT